MPVSLFIAYSHQDEPAKKELLKHLRPLLRSAVIKVWHDRLIAPGTDWEHNIDENLRASQIILPLISADFIDSDYCYGVELRQALELHNRREARVIPIILRPCHWQRLPFAKLLVLPKDGKPVSTWPHPDDAYAAIAWSIDRLATEFQAGPEPPYNEPVLAFGGWHGASELGRPRMVDEDHVPSLIRIKNMQTARPVTARCVRAELRYRNAAGTTDFTLAYAPWYTATDPNDSQAHWADSATLEASATASFAFFLTNKHGELWVYQDPFKPVCKLDYGKWEVTMSITSENTTGFTGTLTFTHTKHDGLQPSRPAFALEGVLPMRDVPA